VKAQSTRKDRPELYAVLGLVIVIAVAVLWNFYVVRSAMKWLAMSHHWRSEVLAQPAVNGQLKHVEWDGWGWAGQDTTVYVVFDPTNSLSGAAASKHPGKFSGLPCEVFQVHRLESQWYTVQFYTNEIWGKANTLDCTGA
jgi:hypothetical protein